MCIYVLDYLLKRPIYSTGESEKWQYVGVILTELVSH